ncbi:creatinine amidohydrolase family protein [Mycobacterium kansasii 824]|nr:creatinine amidohydrolase family protein [Mycobacterium kansasii 824]
MTRDIIPDLTTTDPAATSKIAVLPVGAFEQHGPYLPLGTDTLIACAVTTAITKHHRVLQLPPVTFGCSHEHAAYPGTVSIGAPPPSPPSSPTSPSPSPTNRYEG